MPERDHTHGEGPSGDEGPRAETYVRENQTDGEIADNYVRENRTNEECVDDEGGNTRGFGTSAGASDSLEEPVSSPFEFGSEAEEAVEEPSSSPFELSPQEVNDEPSGVWASPEGTRNLDRGRPIDMLMGPPGAASIILPDEWVERDGLIVGTTTAGRPDLLAERLQSLWSSRMSGRWTEPQGQSRSHADNHGETCSCRAFWVTTSRESPTETSGSPGLGPCRDRGRNSRAPPFACATTGG